METKVRIKLPNGMYVGGVLSTMGWGITSDPTKAAVFGTATESARIKMYLDVHRGSVKEEV